MGPPQVGEPRAETPHANTISAIACHSAERPLRRLQRRELPRACRMSTSRGTQYQWGMSP